MANVMFKKGLLANLPAGINAGTLYVTTDERALYLDVDDTTRIRIGDFQEFETLAALQANTNPSTSALYYVTELNVLAKWDGTKYVQINLDTGATAVNITGTGNAIDGVSYDPATRTLTFTKTNTFTTGDDVDSKINAKVGELKIGDETFETVKAYVDKKTDGIATDTALETLTGRVTTAEGKIDTLIDADPGKSVRTIANEELAKQLIPENASESLDTLAEIAAWIQEHPDDAAAMNAAIEALQAKVVLGTHEVDGQQVEYATVKAYVEAAIAALNIGDYAAAADLTALAARVTTLEGSAHTHANKALLDTYTQTEADLADAVTKKHSHANGTVLGGVTAEKVAAWDAAGQKAHEHANKTVLDGITTAKVTAWDAAEQNAKNYADGLADNYDPAGSAAAVVGQSGDAKTADTVFGAKAYADDAVEAAMTWGTF